MRRTACCSVLVISLAACGTDGNGAGPPSTTVGEPIASGEQKIYVLDDLQDWVSYTDHVSVVRITGEERGEVQGPGAPKEGWLETTWIASVETVLWRSAGAKVPTEIRFHGEGYAVHDGDLHPFAEEGAPVVKVGGTYVVALSTLDGELVPWTGDSVQLLEDGRVNAPADGTTGSELIAGMTPSEIASRLAGLTPAPEAVAYMEVESGRRYVAANNRKSG